MSKIRYYNFNKFGHFAKDCKKPNKRKKGSFYALAITKEEPYVPFYPIEPEDPMERILEAPPIKRRPTWFRETLQEATKHATPSRTFREKKGHKDTLDW